MVGGVRALHQQGRVGVVMVVSLCCSMLGGETRV